MLCGSYLRRTTSQSDCESFFEKKHASLRVQSLMSREENKMADKENARRSAINPRILSFKVFQRGQIRTKKESQKVEVRAEGRQRSRPNEPRVLNPRTGIKNQVHPGVAW